MSNLQYNRLFRFLVCLVLVLSFLVNFSPLNVRAIDPATVTAFSFAVRSVIASILISLGFDFCKAGLNDCISLVNNVFDYISNETRPYFINENGEIVVKCAVSHDDIIYAPQELVNAIRSFLFSESILTESGVKQFWAIYNGVLLPSVPTKDPYAAILYYNNEYWCFTSSSTMNFRVRSNGNTYMRTNVSAPITKYRILSTDEWTVSIGQFDSLELGVSSSEITFLWANHDVVSYDDNSQVVIAASDPVTSEDILSSYDIPLAHVAPEDEPLEVGYPDWSIGSVQIPGSIYGLDEDVLGLPVALGQTLDETLTFNQLQTWQGLGTLELEDLETPDPSLPPSDLPIVDIGPYGFDLRDYFPFCIPFDIYEFFSVLIADPKAPVFHWELHDLSGNTYSIDVDLSPWDSFAEVFRRMQLLLFIVGLAAGSRKFIKW